MQIVEIRVASKAQAYTCGTKTVSLIAARLEIVGTLSQGHRNCMKGRLKQANEKKKRRWLIAFHGGTAWIGHPRSALDKRVTNGDLEEVGHLLGLCLSSSHAAVPVSPDADLALPSNIHFQDPDPTKGLLTITAPPDRNRGNYHARGDTRGRSHP